MPNSRFFLSRANASYVEAMYQRYQADPATVPDDWALFFAGFDYAASPLPAFRVHRARGPIPAAASVATDLPAPGSPAAQVFGLVSAYREFGHLVARLDPLSEPVRLASAARTRALLARGADLSGPSTRVHSAASSTARCRNSSARCARPIAARWVPNTWTSPIAIAAIGSKSTWSGIATGPSCRPRSARASSKA